MKKQALAACKFVLGTVLLAVAACTLGCGGGGAGSVTPPPPTPPSIQVVVTPRTGTVFLGGTLAFSATVSNTTNTAVSWSVNGTPGGSIQAGTISADGVYTAPTDLPLGGTIQVTATSHADASKFATASVVVSSDIAISVNPGAPSVELGSTQTFHASIASSGRPDATVHWSLSGAACPNACGSLDANGNYTAPQILPVPANVTVTATSAADPSKQSSANVTISSQFALQLTAPTTLQPGATQALVATMTPVPGSNPNSLLAWSLTGTGCSGGGCGILTVTTTQAAGGVAIADTANYTAPSTPPQPNTITVTVTPQADPSKRAQANISIQGGASLGLSPVTATLAANHRVTLTATPGGSLSGALAWNVNGISGGNTTLGQICASGSNPCQQIASGTATQVDYVAPGAIPSPNPVSVSVSSVANPSLAAAMQVTVMNHVLVSVLPNSVTLSRMGVQGFTASVLGTSNQNVVWQIAGAACTASGICGSITPLGTYTAPAVPPSPNAFQVVAISQDDGTQSGFAAITISNTANMLSLHPASVYTGAANGFTLRVDGSGFVVSTPGPGSTLMIGGSPRVTSCLSVNECSAPVAASDVAQAMSIPIQIKNPDNSSSNFLSLVVVAPSATDEVIVLDAGAPSATNRNIVVVEPTSAGLDSDAVNLDMTVAAVGSFNTATNTCSLGGSPIPLTRPASGTTAADICLFSQAGFDTGMSYSISGNGDVAVISKQPAGLGIIHLTLQVPAAAATGSRTLFIQNANLDRTAATGVLEVQ